MNKLKIIIVEALGSDPNPGSLTPNSPILSDKELIEVRPQSLK